MIWRDPADFDPLPLLRTAGFVPRKKGQRRKTRNASEIINLVTAFDIETTTLHFPSTETCKYNDHAFMYIWQWQFGADNTVIGRSWDEWKELCYKIHDALLTIREEQKLDKIPRLIGYVHNLAYEFSFICGIYEFKKGDCFFRKERKPIYITMYDCIEYRCSYIQSNMSLDHFVKKMGASTHKQSGQKFNYHKIRFPWTELTDEQLLYCIDDVISLEQAIRLQMQKDGDTLITIPLTSTGYVRRDCKRALAPYRRRVIEPMLPKVSDYKLLRECFRGGNTHANRAYSGKIIDNVQSVDMSSCYPAQQLTKLFPMTRFKSIGKPTIKRVFRFMGCGYAVIGRYQFAGLELKNHKEPIPYLSYAKCKADNPILDNGRILEAEKLQTSLTEIDLQIVLKQYKFTEISVSEAMIAKKRHLPEVYCDVIRKYYESKTKLKGLAGQDNEYTYMKQKNKLNGIYGMSAQDPIHQQIDFDGIDYIVSDYESDGSEHALEKANFPYSWGVYTTAYARAALQDGIDLAGDSIIYCDTDSVKTAGHVDFTTLNQKRQQAAEANKAFADDPKGNRHYMGVFQVDAHYKRFITQGAKRYAFEKQHDGKVQLALTVSGVTHQVDEKTGLQFCVEQLGKLQNFKPGMIWRKAGGTAAVYNDADDFDYTDKDSGRTVHISRNVAIVDSTYELEYSNDYQKLLKNLVLYGTYKKETE